MIIDSCEIALVFIRRRPAFNEDVFRFAEEYFSIGDFDTVSEYAKADHRIDVDSSVHEDSSEVFEYIRDNIDLSHVIFRDRLLRNLAFDSAFMLIRRAVGHILRILASRNYEILISHPVDNYVVDLLCQIAKKAGIRVYGLISFFVGGYKRITTFGEHVCVREPSKEESQRLLERFQTDFQSEMALPKKRALGAAVKRYIKYKGRYLIFHGIFNKILSRKSFDFLVMPYMATTRNLDNFTSYFQVGKQVEPCQDDILLPLHYHPEATIDYWSNDLFCVDYRSSLFATLDKFSRSSQTLLVKEHPAMVFHNSSKFYRKLKSFPNVKLIDPFIPVNALLGKVGSVICWTGSVGLEALILGKSVYFVSDNYYLQASSELSSRDVIGRDFVHIDDPLLLISEVLSGTIKW